MELAQAREAAASRKRQREEEKAAVARPAAALATFVARDVVVRLSGRPVLWRHAFGSCSRQVLAAVDEPVVLDLAAEEDGTDGIRRRQRGAWQAAQRRLALRRNARAAAARWEAEMRATGAEADDSGRWAIETIVQVQRPARRRGQQLDVLVRWAGEAAEETWEPLNRGRFLGVSRRTTTLLRAAGSSSINVEVQRYTEAAATDAV